MNHDGESIDITAGTVSGCNTTSMLSTPKIASVQKELRMEAKKTGVAPGSWCSFFQALPPYSNKRQFLIKL